MNIAVNVRLLLKDKLEGIGRFTFETLKILTTQHPEHTFYFIFDRKYSSEFIFSNNIKPIVIYPQSRHPLLWYIYFEHSTPYILKKIKADVFLSTDGYISLNSNIPSIPVIHDISFEHFPQFVPKLVQKYYKYYFPKYAQKAARIATVSEFCKKDISKLYNVSENKIDVLCNGVSSVFAPISNQEKESVRKKYSNGCPYFLFIGSIHPRKNLDNQIKGFIKFKSETSNDVKLVVVGENMWRNYGNVDNNSHPDIIYTGRIIDDNELAKLHCSSIALTYVSFFEGFGIPILEAMSCETAIITSNISAMPEVGGDAALYADPYSDDSIASAMLQIYTDNSLRSKLIAKGLQQKLKFSWQKSADRLFECVEKVNLH